MAFSVAPLLARGLGPESRGIYASITNTYLLLAVIFGMGIDTAITTSKDKYMHYSVVTGLFQKYRFILIFFSCAATFQITRLLFGNKLNIFLDLSLSLLMPTLILFNFTAGWARNRRELKILGLMQSVPAVIRSVCILILYEIHFLNTESAIFCTFIANLPYLSLVFKRNTQIKATRKYDLEDYFKKGLHAWPQSILTICTYRLDQVVGFYIIGGYELGLYAVAVTIAEIPLLLARSYRDGMFSPLVVNLSQLRRTAIIRSGSLIFLLAAGVPLVFVKVFGDSYSSAVVVCELVLVAVFFQILFELQCVIPLRNQSFLPIVCSQCIYLLSSSSLAIALREYGALALAAGNILGYFLGLFSLRILTSRAKGMSKLA